jgi:DNA polymerase III beta subunit
MVRIEQLALNDALKLCLPVTARSGQLPIFSSVRLTLSGGSGSAIATDGDVSVFAHVDGEKTLDGIDVVVPARHLAGFVNSVRGTVTLEVEDNDLKVTAGGSSLTLRTMFVDDFPKIATADGDSVVLGDVSRARLSRILYAASKDSARPILCGVGIGDGWAACTDSYRLAAIEISNLPQAIIPARVFELVFKHTSGDVAVTVDDRRVTFRTAQATYTGRLLEGTFPAWRRLVTEPTHRVVMMRDDALAALSRVSVLITNDEPVRLEPSATGLRFTVMSRDVGEVSELVDADSDFEARIGFNAKYLMDTLKASTTDKVEIGLVDESKPAIIQTATSIDLLMPVRIAS